MTQDLAQWLLAQLDGDALWATEASRRDGGQAPDGGVHWHWVASSTDEEVNPDPSREGNVGEELDETVSLRSRETWPTTSGVGELPQFALYADEVLSTVGGHIIRHDPARVLRDVDAKRKIVSLHTPTERPTMAPAVCPTCVTWNYETAMGDEAATELKEPCPTLRLLALPYSNRPGYREEWRP